MMRYIIAGLVLLLTPLAVVAHTYASFNSDNVLKTPILSYDLNGTQFTYKTPFHHIKNSDLVLPSNKIIGASDIHLIRGPENSAYAYMIRRDRTAPVTDIRSDGYNINGIVSKHEAEGFDIRYGLEQLSLSQNILSRLNAAADPQLKAVWHVRVTGDVRFAGLEINGVFEPYQFSRKDVLLGLTQ